MIKINFFKRKGIKTVFYSVLMLASFSVFQLQTFGSPILLDTNSSNKGYWNIPDEKFAFPVTGRITTEAGQAISGVSVMEKGTANGTVTDANGKFSLDVANEKATLIISHIGYASQEIAVRGQAVIDVSISEGVNKLDEVVVVGYGTQRKRDITGATSTISKDQISQFPLARVDQAIQGRSSGVYVLNSDGSPGGNTMIRIRGLNSINGGNQPLIVIDGLQGGNLNSLNPNDVETMEILKDASATAIYGSRGANGVILVTTKLGKTGKPLIDAGYSVGFQELARKLPIMNAGDFARTYNKYKMTNTGGGNTPVPEFSDADIAEYDKTGGTDWQDQIYETGVVHNANLSISGATDKVSYMVSSGYLDHKGILLNSKYSRASLRANLKAEITKWLDFGLNYSYTREKYESPAFKDEVAFVSMTINNAPRWAPTEPVYDNNGNYWRHRSGYGASDTWNPVASAVEPIIDNPTYENNANLYLNFKLYKGLSLKVIGALQSSSGYNRDYYNLKTQSGLSANGVGHINQSVYKSLQNSNILTYDNTFGEHHITFTGLAEQIRSEFMGSSMQGTDFLVDQLNFDNMAGAKNVVISSYHGERVLESYMGRINYGFKDRYLVTLTTRADGSSVFGAGNKWGYFPSGSLAWRVSEENFLKNNSVINDLKIRASYGVTGNQGISPYSSLAALGSGSNYNYPWDNQVDNNGFGIARIANPNLKWESTAQSDIGFDISLFKGRLNSTFDLYKKVTKDLLMPRELPGYVGVSTISDNIGSIENKGLEFMIEGYPLVGKLKWNTSFNISVNRNKILDLGPGTKRISYGASTGGYSLGQNFMYLEVDQPFGLMNGWQYLGMWRSDQDAEARSFGQLPGMPHYADLSGPDNKPDGVIDSYDQVKIGNAYPKFTWGFSNRFTFMGAELSFLLIGYEGNDLFNTMRIRRESFWEGNDPKLMNPWTPQNQGSDIPALYDGKYVEDQHLVSKLNMDNEGQTSRWVEDASFVKIKVVTLAYSFDNRQLKHIGFTKARVYFSGTNLVTFTKYTGYDPEIAAFANNDATLGVDLSVYPPARTFTFGINFTF